MRHERTDLKPHDIAETLAGLNQKFQRRSQRLAQYTARERNPIIVTWCFRHRLTFAVKGSAIRPNSCKAAAKLEELEWCRSLRRARVWCRTRYIRLVNAIHGRWFMFTTRFHTVFSLAGAMLMISASA